MAVPPGSRYEVADRLATFSHSYSTRGYPLLSGDVGKTSLHIRIDLREALYRVTTEPDIPGATTAYYAKETENLPFLGFKILDDPNQWHVLAEMNPQIWYPLDIMPGAYLRLPVT